MGNIGYVIALALELDKGVFGNIKAGISDHSIVELDRARLFKGASTVDDLVGVLLAATSGDAEVCAGRTIRVTDVACLTTVPGIDDIDEFSVGAAYLTVAVSLPFMLA
jgi:hypothetical protein